MSSIVAGPASVRRARSPRHPAAQKTAKLRSRCHSPTRIDIPNVGPEHNFIVNKVPVEAIACLALTFLPTGRWFGVAAVFAWLFGRRTK